MPTNTHRLQSDPAWGVDTRENRPGVPKEHAAAVPNPSVAERQPSPGKPYGRVARFHPTPVYGSAQPLHGLSGVIRRRAYDIPEHGNAHWLLLMLGDRVDVVESAVADTVRRRPAAATAGALLLFLGWMALRRRTSG